MCFRWWKLVDNGGFKLKKFETNENCQFSIIFFCFKMMVLVYTNWYEKRKKQKEKTYSTNTCLYYKQNKQTKKQNKIKQNKKIT